MSLRTLLRLASQLPCTSAQTLGSARAISMSGSAILVTGVSKPLAKMPSAACSGAAAPRVMAMARAMAAMDGAARRFEMDMRGCFLLRLSEAGLARCIHPSNALWHQVATCAVGAANEFLPAAYSHRKRCGQSVSAYQLWSAHRSVCVAGVAKVLTIAFLRERRNFCTCRGSTM